LSERLREDGRVTAEEALELRRAVFPDGVVSRHEAETLIALEARVAPHDAAWAHAFVEALVDHVLQSSAYPGHVDDASLGWLESRFGKAGARETEVETLLKLMERSESAPARLSAFARERITALLAGRPIGGAETELVRRCLYAAAGAGATAVAEDEARWLFALDADSDGRANDPAWRDLFVKGVLNHLMGRRAPKLLQAEGMLSRQAWLGDREEGGPLPFFARAFDGGFDAFKTKLRQPGDADRLEAHYDAANAEAEEDAKLTLAEIAWTVGMAKEDRKRTANEEALLAELRKLEA
jgi:hypothetical protein